MPDQANIDRFRDGLLQLLPPGIALTRDPESDLGKLCEALSVEPARVYERQVTIRRESVPSDATEDGLLALWEAVFGIEADGTEADRQAALRAKLRGRLGHSIEAYTSVAQAYGYARISEVERYPRAACGQSACGDSMYADEWAHVIIVHVEAVSSSEPPSNRDASVAEALRSLARVHGTVMVVVERPSSGGSSAFPATFPYPLA